MADKQYEDMINGVIGQVDRVADKIIEIKTKYEPKSYDYSSVASTLSIVAADGGQQASITPPAGVDTVPIGTYTKIIITPPGTPQETPGDDDQVTLNGSFLWINKLNTDIMQWREIKSHVANGEIMVIERIADSGGFKNFQLVRWENPVIATGSVDIQVKYSSVSNDTTAIDIPFDDVISGTITMMPSGTTGINTNSVALIKRDETQWDALIHLESEYIMTLHKTPEGKCSLSNGGKGKITSYSIAYKEVT